MADVYQRISPSDQFILDEDTGDILGIRNRRMSGGDLRVDLLTTGQKAAMAALDTATPTAADTVLGVTEAGSVRRFAVGSMASFVSLKDPRFGLAYDGTTDDTAALNAAFTTAAAAGYKLIGDAGQILVNSATLKIPSGLYIEWEPGAEILHQFPITGTRGFLENSDHTTKISDVYWRGCTITGLDATNSKGNVFCLYGDDIRLVDVVIDGFGDTGRAFFVSGDRIKIIRPKVINPFGGSGSGGIRVLGGDSFLCHGAYVHSGDDCFQFVTGEVIDTSGYSDKDITNGTYSDCFGISDTARVVIAQVNDAFASMSANMTNVRFDNCSGVSAGTGGTIFLGAQTAYGNGHTGTIRDVIVDGGVYECSSSSSTTPMVSLVGTAADSSVVSGLQLNGVTLRPADSDAEVLKTSGYHTGAKVRDCTLYASTKAAATTPTVDIYQGDDVEISGGTIYQGTATIALKTPNAAGRACTGLTVSGVEFRDCHDSVVYDNYATGSVYVANVFRKLSGGASATAITTTANSTSAKARASVFDGIETAYLDAGTGSELFGNDSTGTFTPTVTFSTAGDLSVVYTAQTAIYSKVNNVVTFRIELAFTPTHTTASGTLRIGGLPYTAKNDGTYVGGGAVVSQTSALSYGTGYTVVVPAAVHNQTYLQLVANGSGKNSSALSATNFPTGTAQSLSIAGYYLTAS